jgi:hypothetical protein
VFKVLAKFLIVGPKLPSNAIWLAGFSDMALAIEKSKFAHLHPRAIRKSPRLWVPKTKVMPVVFAAEAR